MLLQIPTYDHLQLNAFIYEEGESKTSLYYSVYCILTQNRQLILFASFDIFHIKRCHITVCFHRMALPNSAVCTPIAVGVDKHKNQVIFTLFHRGISVMKLFEFQSLYLMTALEVFTSSNNQMEKNNCDQLNLIELPLMA